LQESLGDPSFDERQLEWKEYQLVESARDLIRARSLSVLRRLGEDGERKGDVVKFLIETEILNKLNISLSGSDLSRANLSWCDLSWARLTGANLIDTHLRKADLSKADLSWARLTGADLSRANLSGAKLTGADLNRANLSGVRWDERTSWPDLEKFKGTINIPEALKKQFGFEK
jgi:uncharacterized protein YjbI with pentapeptide repeats